MTQYLNSPLFGVTITIFVFFISNYLYQRTRKPIFNPTLLVTASIICFLLYFNIDYETYNIGGSLISFFIAPATVVFAVPLYKNINLLKKSWIPILVGITVGSLAGLFTIYILCNLLDIEEVIMISMFPKSTTSAISMGIAEQIGGLPILAVSFTAVAGIGGNAMGEHILKIFKIDDRISKGVALGTASHALGTAKAMEMGEVEGALSSLSISLAGVISVFLISWFMNLII